MRDPSPLHDVPKKLLDQPKWREIWKLVVARRKHLLSQRARIRRFDGLLLEGLGSGAEARRCYRLGKSLLEDCRLRFIKGTLVARGKNRNGVTTIIPADWWSSLYPLFATDRIQSRTRQFTNVEVYDASEDLTASESHLMTASAG